MRKTMLQLLLITALACASASANATPVGPPARRKCMEIPHEDFKCDPDHVFHKHQECGTAQDIPACWFDGKPTHADTKGEGCCVREETCGDVAERNKNFKCGFGFELNEGLVCGVYTDAHCWTNGKISQGGSDATDVCCKATKKETCKSAAEAFPNGFKCDAGSVLNEDLTCGPFTGNPCWTTVDGASKPTHGENAGEHCCLPQKTCGDMAVDDSEFVCSGLGDFHEALLQADLPCGNPGQIPCHDNGRPLYSNIAGEACCRTLTCQDFINLVSPDFTCQPGYTVNDELLCADAYNDFRPCYNFNYGRLTHSNEPEGSCCLPATGQLNCNAITHTHPFDDNIVNFDCDDGYIKANQVCGGTSGVNCWNEDLTRPSHGPGQCCVLEPNV